MEFRLSQFSVTRNALTSSSFLSKCSNKRLHHVHAQICRCQMQGTAPKGQDSTRKYLVHVVKEGETLSSITNLYGVSTSDIAVANKDIVDFGLVLKGQLIRIPYSVVKNKTEPTRTLRLRSPERDSGFNLYSICLNLKDSTLMSFHQPSHIKFSSNLNRRGIDYHAKTIGFVLLLVPLIAFCIRCLMAALHSRDAEVIKSKENQIEGGSKRMRWKSALHELRGEDEEGIDLRPESNVFTEEEDEIDSKERSQSYTKLEKDYQKFLSECGMSEWGQWRGGYPC